MSREVAGSRGGGNGEGKKLSSGLDLTELLPSHWSMALAGRNCSGFISIVHHYPERCKSALAHSGPEKVPGHCEIHNAF